jgi:hypothetical protein
MKSVRRLPVFLFLLTILSAVGVDLSASDPSEKVYAHPLAVYDEFVSVFFVPFYTTNETSKVIDVRAAIVAALNHSDTYDFMFLYPDPGDLQNLEKRAFANTTDGSLCPRADYWKKSRARYLLFGDYSTAGDELATSVFFYDTREQQMLVHARYRTAISNESELWVKIVQDIEKHLLLKGPKTMLRPKQKTR